VFDAALVGAALAMVSDLKASGMPTPGDLDTAASIAAVLLGGAVAAAIVVRLPPNPVGWVLLALFTTYAMAGGAGLYPDWASRPGTEGWPWAGAVSALEQPSWLVMLGLVGAAFLLVPDGRPPRPGWRLMLPAWCGLVLAAYVVQVAPAPGWLRGALAVGTVLCLVCCVAAVFVRGHDGSPEVRRQLGWVVLSAAVVPVFVVSLVAAHLLTGPDGGPTVFVETFGFDLVLVAIPVGMLLAMTRYRLYAVDDVVDTAVAWAAASVILGLVFGAVIVLSGVVAGVSAQRSPVVVALATATAVLLARPLHARLQQVVNRRFHRQIHDARRVWTAFAARLAEGSADLDALEGALRRAAGDPRLQVEVPLADGKWTRLDGAPGMIAAEDSIHLVVRNGVAVARLIGSPGGEEDEVLKALADAAALPLDNARLRAQATAQLDEVRASRQRIVEAQFAERRRLERDLHDGAQQRLVVALMALSFVRNGSGRGDDTAPLDRAIDEVEAAIREVRELGRGLHPAMLTEQGLVAAVESLADRLPLPVSVRLPPLARVRADSAAAAYFAVCECLTNALKHAEPTRAWVTGECPNGVLHLEVGDDGRGGAFVRSGGGLAGLTDRLEALGGSLRLQSPQGQGTRVMLELPCES
jgi:signal transduction histidine kinase